MGDERVPQSPNAPEAVTESELDRRDSLPQIVPPQTPRNPPAKSFISTDTSGRGSSLSPNLQNILGFRWPRKGSPKHPRRRPLPTSLSLLFSATGRTLLLWRRNGHSLVRMDIESYKTQSLPLLNAVLRTGGDREVNIKLVAEGHGRIAVILYHRQVI